jgi:hypothetical protein
MVAASDDSAPKQLSIFLVRCWSGTEDVLVKVESYSVYEAADDARHEHPGYEHYDAVLVLQSAPEADRGNTATIGDGNSGPLPMRVSARDLP